MGAVLLTAGAVAALHASGVGVCLFRRLTGLPCLTCGSTRAFALLLGGHPWQAVARQPLAVAAALAALIGVPVACYDLLVRGRVAYVRFTRQEKRIVCVAVAVAAALNWLYLMWRGA